MSEQLRKASAQLAYARQVDDWRKVKVSDMLAFYDQAENELKANPTKGARDE